MGRYYGAATGLIIDSLSRGLFITFEGGEGAGKSTQILRAQAFLKEQGIQAITTREPGGTQGGELIRQLVLSGQARHLGAQAEALLFAAARIDHIEFVIRPALAAGIWVLCDRFADSTRVYQAAPVREQQDGAEHYAKPSPPGQLTQKKLKSKFLAQLEYVAILDMMPDRTYLIDIPAAIGMERIAARAGHAGSGGPDRFESETLEIHEQRRAAYLALAQENPQRILVIDGNRAEDKVFEDIRYDLDHRFGPVFHWHSAANAASRQS